MTPHTVSISGREVAIAWNQGTARRFGFRVAKHAVRLDTRALFDPLRASAAYVEMLWLLLPPEEHDRHRSAEDLATAIDLETQAPAITASVLACLAEMLVGDEKKTSSASTPSPGSNSGSPQANGTRSTRTKRQPTSKRGTSAKSGRKSGSQPSATSSRPPAA
jgi:hypothetical protein